MPQAFAGNTHQCNVKAHCSAHSQLRLIFVPEVKLGDVIVQVLLAATMVQALLAAREDGEEAFDGVRMRVAAHELVGTVAH
jgi:hypothetical protein